MANQIINYIQNLIHNIPEDWIKLTTHRLDIYNEDRAKTEFLEELERLYQRNVHDKSALKNLPTAYDYIRLGHPLSCVLEWVVSKQNHLKAEQVIGFSSKTMGIMAVLRKNHFEGKKTNIYIKSDLPSSFDVDAVKRIYDYDFEITKIESHNEILNFDGSNVLLEHKSKIEEIKFNLNIDFYINIHEEFGSIIHISDKNLNYISYIQHVRRRESVAITPGDSLKALKRLADSNNEVKQTSSSKEVELMVHRIIKEITHTTAKPLLGSCGLSVQYAIMMGLIDRALTLHPNKPIKVVVPPNCYGGTNDQARRVAASLDNVDIMDLPVDGDNDMVKSTDEVLKNVAEIDAVPLIIAEIPTNPRVEVPNLEELKSVLTQKRKTKEGNGAVKPIFILDQTFCPNYNFLGENKILSQVETIAYASGSKFPSGGKCTAGYLVANKKAEYLLEKIEKHLKICDNQATSFQIEILAEQMPSMLQRIDKAYENTREFVEFIKNKLPNSKINFVSDELAEQGFRPSVFSLDLPTKGNTAEERENYKRELNHRLINMMISEIPESKHCVSYGQLKGCYWTIPATSTQGTTKEEDKDYIARVSVSPDLNLEKHKEVFCDFVNSIS